MGLVQDWLSAIYPWTTVLHVAAVISWMAGLFYLPRLYVYHVEKGSTNPDLADAYVEMEYKLLKVIMNPASVATWVFGLMLVFTPGIVDWSQGWPWIKAAMVIGMTVFHHFLMRWRKELAAGRSDKSGKFFRLANEAPTVMMLIIVAMVIAKPF